MILDGYSHVDNVTDATLASYREHYGDAGITKEDIFFYVYALLHHPEYRERYEDDLKKMLPHIPRAAGFHTYASVGRELADLHVNYERVAVSVGAEGDEPARACGPVGALPDRRAQDAFPEAGAPR